MARLEAVKARTTSRFNRRAKAHERTKNRGQSTEDDGYTEKRKHLILVRLLGEPGTQDQARTRNAEQRTEDLRTAFHDWTNTRNAIG
jgi:hypothetical protein